jgi:hypothetical protein
MRVAPQPSHWIKASFTEVPVIFPPLLKAIGFFAASMGRGKQLVKDGRGKSGIAAAAMRGMAG